MSIETKPQTFATILNTCRNIFMNGSTFQEWKEYKDYLINDEMIVKAALSKATIPELNRFVLKDKKDRMVSSLYSSLLTTCNLSDSFAYSPMEESYKDAFLRITSKYTEADFYAYKEVKKAANDAKMKALNNPQTLDEFRTFINYKGEKALSIELRIRYDELIADTRKAVIIRQEEQKAEVEKVESVNAAELKQEVKEEKQQTAAEALKEKGFKAISDGTEELNKDRQDNTHRRAAMAANAERTATAKVEFGKILVKIAEKMESGEIKYLDKVRTAADLETLNNILQRARYRHIEKNKLINSRDFVMNSETVFFAEIPYPLVYSNNKSDLLRMQEHSNGKKLAAARMLKRFGNGENGGEFVECNTTQRIEDFETLFLTRCSVWSEWQIKFKKDALLAYKRIERMGLNQINTLRAALIELIELKNGTQDSETARKLKVKELERKYIGAKIPGFFPTPKTLAEQKIYLLDLQPTDKICEPSAGLGHIADLIKAKGFDVTCIEIHSGLAEVLKEKGHNVINEDFLQHSNKYDKIIMNPPFENLQDVAHVKHAFNLLNEGGALVATMANNKSRTPDFIEFVEQNGWYEVNPENSFANAFNSTGVSTITVFLSK
jgi:hypothetical protein